MVKLVTHGTSESDTSESLSEKIERLEQELEEAKEDLTNMTLEKDIEYDRAERLQERLDAIHEGHTLEEDEDVLLAEDNDQEIRDTALALKLSYERLQLGVLSEIEEIIKHTDELISLVE